MGFLGQYQDAALHDTCTIETGTVIAPTSTTVSCLAIPATSSKDDSLFRVLVSDPDRTYQIGIRVVYHGVRYLVQQVEYDHHTTFARLHCQSWSETLS